MRIMKFFGRVDATPNKTPQIADVRNQDVAHDRAPAANSVPKGFRCPITKDIMSEPVVGPNGCTYEREAITRWVNTHGTDPLTRQPIPAGYVWSPNRDLQSAIASYKNAQPMDRRPPPLAQVSPHAALAQEAEAAAQAKVRKRMHAVMLDRSVNLEGCLPHAGFERFVAPDNTRLMNIISRVLIARPSLCLFDDGGLVTLGKFVASIADRSDDDIETSLHMFIRFVLEPNRPNCEQAAEEYLYIVQEHSHEEIKTLLGLLENTPLNPAMFLAFSASERLCLIEAMIQAGMANAEIFSSLQRLRTRGASTDALILLLISPKANDVAGWLPCDMMHLNLCIPEYRSEIVALMEKLKKANVMSYPVEVLQHVLPEFSRLIVSEQSTWLENQETLLAALREDNSTSKVQSILAAGPQSTSRLKHMLTNKGLPRWLSGDARKG